MLNIQRFLKNYPIEALAEMDIKFKQYPDRVIFKYTMASPKTNPIVTECRGLILSSDFKTILSRPFDRFFNYGEGTTEFDWNHAEVYFKHDGSLIQVYHDGEKWCAGTSGTAFAEGEIQIKGIMKKTYFELFSEAIGNDIQKTFKNYNKNFTFLFELVSPENRIVTRYSKTEAFLLAIRNKVTGQYINCNDYPEFTQPEKFNLNNPDDIVSMVESLSDFKEGVVCYDPTTGNRIKYYSRAYS
jgi:tRNA splicing ligase